MLKFLITLAVGVYTGIYVAQNYDVPAVNDPQELYRKICDFAEKHKKPEP